MDNRFAPFIKNAFINVLNHRETNFILTVFAVLFTTILPSLVFLIGISFDTNSSFMVLGEEQYSMARMDPLDLLISTVFSLYALWLLGLIAGRFMSYFFLPPLMGMLLIGILIANIPFFQGILLIHTNWNKVIQQTAFVVILIRCGLSLDPDALRNSLFICGNLAIISTTIEVVAIVLFSHFVYGLPVYAAILFGYVLASTAPAITVPILIQLQNEGIGVEKGIPTATFTNMDDLSYTLTRFPVEILVGSLFGILTGLLLRSLPRYDSHLAHFTRATLLFSTSLAFHFGTRAINFHEMEN
uniref:Cation/H+ exchanger domain-containing protein n=1 Tax=Ditylenchus dipsaci TaxID=166011 RepID=A0A915CQP5_9BILA